MKVHPRIEEIASKFERKELHAARSGREVMSAFSRVIEESRATTVSDLFREVEANIDALLAVMPAYAPPINVMHRIMAMSEQAFSASSPIEEFKGGFSSHARKFVNWSEDARGKIAQYGAELLEEGTTVFTFTMSETALRTLLLAWEQGKTFRVLVTESRPNNDGLMTLQQLSDKGVPVEVSVDANLGELIPRADIMIVGAEAIQADGSAVCKVGTYPAALVAKQHGVPLYVVVDSLKFNTTSMLGLSMKLDRIEDGDIEWSDTNERATIAGHLFDATPPELIRGIVTEEGIFHPVSCGSIMREMPISQGLRAKLSAWSIEN